jgi:hypothetical protein
MPKEVCAQACRRDSGTGREAKRRQKAGVGKKAGVLRLLGRRDSRFDPTEDWRFVSGNDSAEPERPGCKSSVELDDEMLWSTVWVQFSGRSSFVYHADRATKLEVAFYSQSNLIARRNRVIDR